MRWHVAAKGGTCAGCQCWRRPAAISFAPAPEQAQPDAADFEGPSLAEIRGLSATCTRCADLIRLGLDPRAITQLGRTSDLQSGVNLRPVNRILRIGYLKRSPPNHQLVALVSKRQRRHLVGRMSETAGVRGIDESPEINAFAAPGGCVIVTRGLYEIPGTDSDVSAVLAHEISHCIERDHYSVPASRNSRRLDRRRYPARSTRGRSNRWPLPVSTWSGTAQRSC